MSVKELEKGKDAREGDEFTGRAIVAKGWVVFRCPVCEKPIKVSEGKRQAAVVCPACESGFDLELPGDDEADRAGNGEAGGLTRSIGEAAQAAVGPDEVMRVVLPGEPEPVGFDGAGGSSRKGERHSKLLRLNPERVPELTPLEEAEFDDAWLAKFDGWGGEENRRDILWIVVGAALLVAAIGGAFLWNMAPPPPAGNGVNPGTPPETEGVVEERIGDVKGALNLFSRFISASGWEEKKALVWRPEDVGPRMEEFYRTHPEAKVETISLKDVARNESGGRRWFTIRFRKVGQLEAFPDLYAYLWKTEEGYALDWESFIGHSELSMERLLRDRPEQPVLVRVIATLSDHYVREFSDEEKFVCLRLYSPDNRSFCFGYLSREHEAAVDLLELLGGEMPGGFGEMPMAYLTLKVRFLPNYEGTRELEIVEVVADSWFNPQRAHGRDSQY